ncbi:MAG: hypothetical protein J07HQX50_01857 [Haloquadratum sp. J07HQX50]|nr:MAG: hypothetical protein J07HQX50_01857 [Haloquadratum sp. J07HQX50]
MEHPVAVLVVQFCPYRLVLVGEQIFRVGRVSFLIGKYVVDFNATVNGRQRHVLVVESGGAVVVDDVRTGEVRHRRFLAVFPLLNHALAGFGGFVSGGLDLVAV